MSFGSKALDSIKDYEWIEKLRQYGYQYHKAIQGSKESLEIKAVVAEKIKGVKQWGVVNDRQVAFLSEVILDCLPSDPLKRHSMFKVVENLKLMVSMDS